MQDLGPNPGTNHLRVNEWYVEIRFAMRGVLLPYFLFAVRIKIVAAMRTDRHNIRCPIENIPVPPKATLVM